MRKIIILCSIILIIFSCNKDISTNNGQGLKPNLPAQTLDYNSKISNVELINNDLATLGRVLFYDKRLSHNFMIACASCHKQENGFGDNIAHSVGFSGIKTPRNSIAIINLFKFNALFWDARDNVLDSMVLKPILNHIEMGVGNLNEVVARVDHYDFYKSLFAKAYGTNEINQEKIGRALAEFVRSIRTTDNFKNRLTSIKNTEGMHLFTKYQCNNCHNIGDRNLSWGGDMANTGLDIIDKDKGAGAVINIPELDGSFKIPSLINVELSGPYMHDGRFNTLEEVLNHYSDNVQPNKNLDFRLREGMEGIVFGSGNFLATQKQQSNSNEVNPRLAKITQQDKKVLIDFLKSLTDAELITDKRYSDPFK
jgi:cytochrome c peroxidase